MSDERQGSAAEQGEPAGSLADAVDDYRRIRGELERGILAAGDVSGWTSVRVSSVPAPTASFRRAATSSSRTKVVTGGWARS